MGGYRKSKGLVLELTSLLDVIMIMLFWVMTNSSASAADAQDSADKKVKEAQARVAAAEERIEQQARDYDAQIEQIKERAIQQEERLNGDAAKNQQAINDFSDGLLITLNVKNDNGTDTLTVSRGEDQLSSYSIGEGLFDQLDLAFVSLGVNDDTAALAAVIYDGDQVLYKDISAVRAAVTGLSQEHENIYFTYINTSK
ncbi:MAG: hypothetical protein IJ571_08795 [Ruminococcus sp.]|nr:hypothetical protein [Ruminococcus sp.]